MLNKGQKYLLNALLDKYERGTSYVQNKKPIQRIKLDLYNGGKSDFKAYDIEKSEIRNQYNADVVNLKAEHLIDFKWMKAEEGHIVADIWLPFEQLGRVYSLLGRVPKGDFVDEILFMLIEAQERVATDWILKYFQYLADTIEKRRSVGSLLPGDKQEIKDFLHALIMIDNLKDEEILERVFSVRCFGDSKKFEALIRPRLVRVLKRYLGDVDEDATEDEMLKRVGIVKYPEQMEFCGAMQIELIGSVVDYSPLQYGATINAKDIKMGKISVSSEVKKVLFIENKANFVDYVFYNKKPEEFIVFHGGCYSPVKGLFFQKIVSAVLPGTEFYHWGDIDYGGFSMLARLRRNIVTSIQSYRMTQRDLLEYRKYTTTFNEAYLHKLVELKSSAELQDCLDCLDTMILNRIKLEQEAMIIKSNS